jgi:hypothetical protein
MHRRLYIHPAHRTVGVSGSRLEMKPYCWHETWPSYSTPAKSMQVAIVFHRQDDDARERMAFFEQAILGQCDAQIDRVAFEALEARPLPSTLAKADAVVWLGRGLQIARHWSDFDAESLAKKELPQLSCSDIEIRASFPGHPVLDGVRSFTAQRSFRRSAGDCPHFRVNENGTVPFGAAAGIPEGATCLMTAQSAGESLPAAWTRYGRRGRVFGTLLGSAEDFRQPDFVRLIMNAIEWVRR